jgi:hypothetical protein
LGVTFRGIVADTLFASQNLVRWHRAILGFDPIWTARAQDAPAKIETGELPVSLAIMLLNVFRLPSFALTAAVALSLGIGANAVFALVDDC